MQQLDSDCFWDIQYQNKTELGSEWYFEYQNIKHILDQYLENRKILHIGCGNSSLSYEMYKDGFIDQCNMDFS